MTPAPLLPRSTRLLLDQTIQRDFFRTGPRTQLCLSQSHNRVHWEFQFQDLDSVHRLARTHCITIADEPDIPAVITHVNGTPVVSYEHARTLLFGGVLNDYLRSLYEEHGIIDFLLPTPSTTPQSIPEPLPTP